MTDWGTSAIAAELAGAATGYAKALTELAGAADYADAAAEHMLPGYPSVARSIRQIKHEIEANHHEVTDLAARIPPLTQTVEQVGSDWTPHQVITALSLVADELERLPRDTLYTANGRLGDTEVLIRRRLQGGSPEQLQARVSGPHSILRAVHVRLCRAKDAVDAVLAAAREAGGREQTATAGGGAQEPPIGPPPVPAKMPADEPEPSSIGHLPPPARQPYGVGVPDYVQRLARRLPARRPDDIAWAAGELPDKTMGIAVAEGSETPLGGGPLASGKLGPNQKKPGLKRYPEFRWGTQNHVEAHVAALMRQDRSLRNVVLTLNNEPCGPAQPRRNRRTGEVLRGQDGNISYKQYTCHEQVEAALPRGARLTIFVADGPDGQVRRWGTYVGTGEGIAAQ